MRWKKAWVSLPFSRLEDLQKLSARCRTVPHMFSALWQEGNVFCWKAREAVKASCTLLPSSILWSLEGFSGPGQITVFTKHQTPRIPTPSPRGGNRKLCWRGSAGSVCWPTGRIQKQSNEALNKQFLKVEPGGHGPAHPVRACNFQCS